MKPLWALSVISLALLLLFQSNLFAHPGNTASDGCHYCRTNCTNWGVPWNQRHCHGGYASQPPRSMFSGLADELSKISAHRRQQAAHQREMELQQLQVKAGPDQQRHEMEMRLRSLRCALVRSR